MNTKRIIFTVVISLFVLSGLGYADPQKWEIDKAHSAIYFEVKHIYAGTRGLFEDFSGHILFDPENKQAGSVEFEVKVDSINTHITQRDNHLRSDDFFDAKQYPLMTFKSKRVKPVSDNNYVLEGDLTVKDVTQSVEIPFTYMGMQDNPLRKGTWVAGFEAPFTIDRLSFNVGSGKYYNMGVLGKDVRIVIALEVLKDK